MAEKKINILADFPAVTTEEWLAKINADLKGADFNRKLVWRTSEGFEVFPFYRQEDVKDKEILNSAPNKFPFVRGTKADNNWFIRQELTSDDIKQEIDFALKNGVDSLGFSIPKGKLSPQYIEDLLNGVNAEEIELNFRICVTKAKELVEILFEYFNLKKYNLKEIKGSINFDPINKMLLKGKSFDEAYIKSLILPLVKEAQKLPSFRVVNVNPVSLSDSGAYIYQELGYALAWGVQYLDLMIDAGIDVSTAAKSMKFNFGVSGNYFMEIAKFRAARMLWAKIVAAYKPECNCGDSCHCQEAKDLDFCTCAAKMKIHAKTSVFNMTLFDAHVNMLRTQTEAMSAAIAGVDSITVTPFDVAYQESDKFSKRIAKNQQLLLKEESNFHKVVDPSGGSYYIETLTENIAKQAWILFLDVVDKGFLNLVINGNVQDEITKTYETRLKKVASRKEILLGTNQYPNTGETANQKIKIKESNCSCKSDSDIKTLPQCRAAKEFEELRLAVERSPKRPKAFMLTIGHLAMRLARSQFSCNFFGCAGYETIDNLGFKTVEDGVKAALDKGADIIVLCSSDDEYAEFAPEAFDLINGRAQFAVAGAPACMDDLKAKGIEYFVNVKSNVLETLQKFNELLNIK